VAEECTKLFTELTGVTCEIVYGGGGELMARVSAESAHPLGDVVEGVTAEVLQPYSQYIELYKLQVAQSLLTEEIPSDGLYAPGDVSVLAVLVNTNLLKESDYPKTWKDLSDPKYKGKIAFADPSASSSAYLQLCTMEQLYGWDFIKEFYKNLDGKILSGSSAVHKGVADGEYALGLSCENYGAKYIAASAPVAIVYPEDGTMKTKGGAAIVKGCPNMDNAKAYVEFTCSKEYSDIMAKYYRRGPRVDATLPAGLPKISEIKFMNYDYEAAGKREDILNNWNNVLKGD